MSEYPRQPDSSQQHFRVRRTLSCHLDGVDAVRRPFAVLLFPASVPIQSIRRHVNSNGPTDGDQDGRQTKLIGYRHRGCERVI
ncbi:Glutaredoxin-like protein [Fusarium oxysporum f. sp. albedinis]|nr:Glutaredoxin-like protein [Fusarium oxysporum f. sp. albedinis]